MKYTIQGGQLPVVVCELKAGEENVHRIRRYETMTDMEAFGKNQKSKAC